jgi:hypothetical protein
LELDIKNAATKWVSFRIHGLYAKRNQKRAIIIPLGARGVLCAPQNKKQSTMKSEDREKQNFNPFFPRTN